MYFLRIFFVLPVNVFSRFFLLCFMVLFLGGCNDQSLGRPGQSAHRGPHRSKPDDRVGGFQVLQAQRQSCQTAGTAWFIYSFSGVGVGGGDVGVVVVDAGAFVAAVLSAVSFFC